MTAFSSQEGGIGKARVRVDRHTAPAMVNQALGTRKAGEWLRPVNTVIQSQCGPMPKTPLNSLLMQYNRALMI